MTMSSSRIPPKSQQDIEDFLTFVAQAKDNPRTDSQLWENLQGLVEKLSASEDKSTKLAQVIKQWCQEYGIKLDPQELKEYRASLRVNMLPKKGQPIPQANPGEKPAVFYNQALILATVQEAIKKQ
jgi:acetylornithine deacetylase/succinyl-diaminopimelate desuccinylase-like protein